MKKPVVTHDLARLLIASAAFSIVLVGARVWRSHSGLYLSLIWNLFLAYIPFFISSCMVRKAGWFRHPLIFAAGLCLWLLFFPNAPYIITDLFHLQPKPRVPLWYDLLLIFSFAWNGLIAGYLSVMQCEQLIRQRVGRFAALCFEGASMCLGAYGVFLGRFLRWNSWDMLTNPFSLTTEMLRMVVHPFHYPAVWGMTLLLSVLMFLIYLTIKKIPGRSS
jgi:uncharacterized membrane protein